MAVAIPVDMDTSYRNSVLRIPSAGKRFTDDFRSDVQFMDFDTMPPSCLGNNSAEQQVEPRQQLDLKVQSKEEGTGR